ncbi:hypothetical protein IJT10_09225, partial [bacterium]|nr:hypothetical protein [bacterium]
LRRYAWRVVTTVAIILSSLLFVPQFSHYLYTHIYELTPELIDYARSVSIFIVLNFVGLACMFWCRAVLLHARKTLVVTIASAVSLLSIFVLMTLLKYTTTLTGVFKAEMALTVGLPAMLVILLPSYLRRMREVRLENVVLPMTKQPDSQVA